jgi:hypothetical protein
MHVSVASNPWGLLVATKVGTVGIQVAMALAICNRPDEYADVILLAEPGLISSASASRGCSQLESPET